MFRWLRQREGKRVVVERAEPDPIAELLRLTGDDHPQPEKQSKKINFASNTRARTRPRVRR